MDFEYFGEKYHQNKNIFLALFKIESDADLEVHHNNTEESVLFYIRKYYIY